MIGRLRQLSEPRLRQQAGIEKSLTPVERDILVQCVRKNHIYLIFPLLKAMPSIRVRALCKREYLVILRNNFITTA